jgi:hypothetical protein
VSEADARGRLEKMKHGAGAMLGQYIDDLRFEERLDVRIVDGRLGIYGTL